MSLNPDFTKMNLQGETKQESFKEWKDRIEAISRCWFGWVSIGW